MRLLSSIFGNKNKKAKKMEINEKSIQEALIYYSAFDFQWVKGDDIGTTETFKNISPNGEITFIEFQSGKRINTELLEEFMIMIPAAPKVTEVSSEILEKEEEYWDWLDTQLDLVENVGIENYIQSQI